MFKLTDGREFVGSYDPQSHVLTARVGGGIIGMPMDESRIASRRPFVPVVPAPPQTAPLAPVAPAKVPPLPPITPVQIPAPDQFLVDPETQAKELAVLLELGDQVDARTGVTGFAKVQLLNSLVDARLNPMNFAMLLSRLPHDPPVRYRFLATLATPDSHALDLAPMRHIYWMLTMYGSGGKSIGVLLVSRNSDDGRRVEAELSKNAYMAVHAWIHLKDSRWLDVFLADRVVSAGTFTFTP